MSQEATLLEREEYSVVGRRVPKYDAQEKVTGRAEYLLDVELPNMLYGRILRSRYPHARIKRIDVTRARSMRGVAAVLTAADTPLVRFGFLKDNLPLKHDKVLSVRDEVAAVAAESEEAAARAIESIDVEYDPLPGVFDPEQALRADAPVLHERSGTNRVPLDFAFEHGHVDEALVRAAHLVEGRFRLNFVSHGALGTMGCAAHFDSKGNLVVYTNSQAPFQFAKELSEATAIPGHRIRVIQPKIGGSFGRGMDLYPVEIITVLLAQRTGRPVKILLAREEELASAPTRQPVVIDLKTGADEDGRLVLRDAYLSLDNGPYVSWGAFDARVMLATVTGIYRVPNVRFRADIVYTNNPYSGTARGAGNPQITFAVESQMDELAEQAGWDPVEFRMRNAYEAGYVTPQGMRVTTCAHEASLRAAAERIGWKGRHHAGVNRGIGFASYFHVGGGARVYRSDGCGAIVKVDDFGGVALITGMTEIGTGTDTALAQIVAEELGVPFERVQVMNDDTAIRPWDVGIHASRGTFVGGNAALLAAREAKTKILAAAAKLLGADPTELRSRNGVISSKREPSKRIGYEKVVRSAHFRESGQIVIGQAFYDPPNEMQDASQLGNISATYGFGTQAVLVEVDPETGRVSVRKVVSVHDAGRILNPLGAEGQVEGGIAMALGMALTEQLVLEDGRVLNTDLGQYKMLTSAEAPEVEVVFVGEPDPAGPFGAKGLGESGAIPTVAAAANAIYDAIRVRMHEAPMTPEAVVKQLTAIGAVS